MAAAKNIIVYGAGWIQNMGNAFIQLGSKEALEQAVPGANVHIVDGNDIPVPLSSTVNALNKAGSLPLLHFLKKPEQHRNHAVQARHIKMSDLTKPDAIVFSGVWLSKKFLEAHKKDLLSFKQRGIPIIFNGGGGTNYNQQEYADVKKLLEQIQPFAIISRDEKVYETYKNVIKHVYSGIDVGFFSADALPHPLPFTNKPTVYCFDRGPLPPHLKVHADTILTHHSVPGLRFNTFAHGKTFYSEFADDYLHLYANTHTVYSDRVHACVATLAFGNKAQLIDTTPRAFLFETVGAGAVRQKPVQLDKQLLAQKKQKHVEALRNIFSALSP